MNKAVTGTIIVVLLILILSLVLKKSREQENFRLGNCDFVATGDNKLDCLNKCQINPNCYHYQCENICNKCTLDKTICPWDEQEETLEPSNLTFGLPSPVVLIRVFKLSNIPIKSFPDLTDIKSNGCLMCPAAPPIFFSYSQSKSSSSSSFFDDPES